MKNYFWVGVAASFIIVGLYVLPFLVLWQDSYVLIHDTADGNIPKWKITFEYFRLDSFLIPLMLPVSFFGLIAEELKHKDDGKRLLIALFVCAVCLFVAFYLGSISGFDSGIRNAYLICGV